MPSTASRTPTRLVAVLIVAVAFGAYLRSRPHPDPERTTAPECAPGDVICEGGRAERAPLPEASQTAAPVATVESTTFCNNVGYLCADLSSAPTVQLRRWTGFEGTMVVYVPVPDFEDPGRGRELQRAVVAGLRAWNNQPFPILAETTLDREPHFSVRWSRSLGGSQLGVTRTRWSQAGGLIVDEIEMGTRSPFDPSRPIDARQIRLTAAHEMGHALGLGHSDQPRDVMYPTNTATAMGANDYRSIEVLYATPNGTTITR